MPPFREPKFFQFHAVFGKIWQNGVLLGFPGGLAPPPRGNPGSAHSLCMHVSKYLQNLFVTVLQFFVVTLKLKTTTTI